MKTSKAKRVRFWLGLVVIGFFIACAGWYGFIYDGYPSLAETQLQGEIDYITFETVLGEPIAVTKREDIESIAGWLRESRSLGLGDEFVPYRFPLNRRLIIEMKGGRKITVMIGGIHHLDPDVTWDEIEWGGYKRIGDNCPLSRVGKMIAIPTRSSDRGVTGLDPCGSPPDSSHD